MNPEESLKNRFRELAERAYATNTYSFTSFLTRSEQAVLEQCRSSLSYVGFSFFGGNPSAERRLAAFGSEELFGYPPNPPICLLEISPRMQKYADELTHRDYLGALLHLGIDRSVLGDIVCRLPLAYVYCLDTIAPFLISELSIVKHTPVVCKESGLSLADIAPAFTALRLIVSSVRTDAVVSGVCHLSRSKSLELFAAGKVFVNGQELRQPSALLKAGDLLVIRGFGKFLFDGVDGKTRKDRLSVVLQKYV